MKTLISQCNKIVTVPPDAAKLITSKFRKKALRAKAMISPGENEGSHIYYLEKGLLRTGRFKRSKVNTSRFIHEGTFFWMVQKSEQGLQALEPSVVYRLPLGELAKILSTWPPFFAILHTHMMNEVSEYWERYLDREELWPLARYKKFLQRYPSFDKRVPIDYIAAFLGIVAGPLFAQPRASRRHLNVKPKVPKKVIYEE